MLLTTRKYEKPVGFTLVELLLVMSVIAVLASLSLVVIGDAQHDARVSATQTRINQIHSTMLQRMEDYQYQRLPRAVEDLTDYIDSSNDTEFAIARELRRRIFADIVNVEMPRSFGNVALNNVIMGPDIFDTYPSQTFIDWVNDNSGLFQSGQVGQLIVDLKGSVPFAADRIQNGSIEFDDYPDGMEADPDSQEAKTRTSSEYLYLILQATESNGILAIEALGNRAFADTDNDGYLEVVDSWGDPIGFRIEMYDDEGKRVENSSADPIIADLDPGFIGSYGTGPNNSFPTINSGVPIRNIRIRIFSNGNDIEVISN